MNKEKIEKYMTGAHDIHPAEDRVYFYMLRDWMLTAMDIEGMYNRSFPCIYQRAIKNVESALNKPWAEVRKELEGME